MYNKKQIQLKSHIYVFFALLFYRAWAAHVAANMNSNIEPIGPSKTSLIL